MKWIENGEGGAAFRCSADKPNVFLIGDSIRKGYCKTAVDELEGKAEVFFPDDNCRSSQYIVFSLKKWVALFDDPQKVDVVLFNCGQWDAAHWNGYELSLTSDDEYGRNLRMIVFLLRRFFPNAQLLFASTSRMNPAPGVTGVNPRSNAEIDRYNEIARGVMDACGIPVVDLNAKMADWGSDCFTDLCHLTPDAFARLGRIVADELLPYLEKKV